MESERLVVTVSTIAQTNVQLYRQLGDAGIAASDLARVRDGYELAAALFTGRYRKSHRPFIAHLVGTASIVAEVDGRPTMVNAALVHAAYSTGDWGRRSSPVAARRREEVRNAVGTEAEELIWHYSQIPAALDALRTWSEAMVREPSPLARDLIVLRLANQVEELQDEPAVRARPVTTGVLMQAARSLGVAEVASRLTDFAIVTNALRIPAPLETRPYPRNVLLPRSAHLALRVRARQAIRRPTARGILRRLRRRA